MLSPFDIFLLLFSGLVVIFDFTENRIPNWLNFLAMGIGLVLNGWQGGTAFLASLYGCGLGIGIFLFPFILGWMGAGDVKLMGALGALLGPSMIPRIAFYTVLAGGCLALFSLLGKKARVRNLTRAWVDLKLLLMTRGVVMPETVGQRSKKGTSTVPYGVAIIAGALIAVYCDPQGHWAGF